MNNNLKQLVANHRVCRNSRNTKDKDALLYIKNGAIISNKKAIKYPNKKVASYYRFTVKNTPAKLSFDSFSLLKQRSKYPFVSRGQVVELPTGTVNLKRKRRNNFYQKNFKNLANIKCFYSLDNKKMKKCIKYSKDWFKPSKSNFLKNVERRLDVILVRLGYANHIEHARLLIKKGVIFVDNIKIVNKNFMISAGSIVETRDPIYPLLWLYKYHLSYYPKTWNKFRRRRQTSWIKKLSNSKSPSSFMLNELSKRSQINLKNKLMWKKGAWKKIINKRGYRYPVSTLANQFTRVGANKTLVTHLFKNKDILIPHSISNMRARKA